MKRGIKELIDEFQRIASRMDVGDFTSDERQPFRGTNSEVIDLMIDAYTLGIRDAAAGEETEKK
jgi:hypothetical protein